MNMVRELNQYRIFTGRYRITSMRTQYTRSGKKYLRFKLDDSSGNITAYAWEGQYAGLGSLHHLMSSKPPVDRDFTTAYGSLT